jgi:hypothetical protein
MAEEDAVISEQIGPYKEAKTTADIAAYPYFLRKSVFWLIGNALFGLLPLIFMKFIFLMSDKKAGGEEIKHLIEDGVIQFVCCAICGASLVDLALSGEKMKISKAYAWGIIPVVIVGLLLTNYILIILKVIDHTCFHIGSNTSLIIISLTVIFCILVKTRLYIKEETKRVTL